jgi:hypothetical protein
MARLGGALALVAGFLIATGGFNSHSFLHDILDLVGGQVPSHLAGAPGELAELVIFILASLISLGGVTVIAGAVALLYRHNTLGRLLIALGGGAGLIGLIFGVGYAVVAQGPSAIGQHVYYWVGILLAAVSRWLAK